MPDSKDSNSFQNEMILRRLSMSFVHVCSSLLGTHLQPKTENLVKLPSFETTYPMLTSLDFSGSVTGFFALSCEESTISKMMGLDPSKEPKSLRQEMVYFLCEVLNTMTGTLMTELKNEFPFITIQSPKVAFTEALFYPNVSYEKLTLKTEFGPIDVGISVDTMEQEVSRLLNKAHSTSETKDRLLEMLTYEIRMPITEVIDLSQKLLNTHLEKDQFHFTNTSVKQSHHLLSRLNNIIDLSKIEEDKLSLNESKFNLYQSLETCLKETIPLLREKNLEIAFIISPKVPQEIFGDSSKINQILSNYLNNAIKFSLENTMIKLSVELIKEQNGFSTIKYIIEDQGNGISFEDQEFLTSSLKKIKNSNIQSNVGSGLGLAISKILATKMRGETGFHSEKNKGSNFWFTTTNKTPTECQHLKLKHPTHSPLNVLLLDSRNSAQTTLKHYFDISGSTLNCFDDIEKCANFYSSLFDLNQPFDSIIININSDIEATQICDFINSNQPFRETPITFLIPYGMSHLAEKIKRIAYRSIFTKPITLNIIRYLLSPLSLDDKLTLQTERPPYLLEYKNYHYLQKKLHFLVIESNPVIEMSLKKMIHKLGINAEFFHNGTQIDDLMNSNSFDMVLLDWDNSITTGPETAEKIRSSSKGKEVPIVALSNQNIEDHQLTSQDFGINELLVKPFKSIDLITAIEKYIG